jgi:hypothetical protein
MPSVQGQDISDLLRAIAEDLDIPSHCYDDAVVKYTDVGEWLAHEQSELAQYDPDIFPQGSFRLGTMVRPISDTDEYDIDLVCHLKIKKESTSQQELKERVGRRLAAREDIKGLLRPSRRCWVLDYPEPFHMDILPVIPNPERLPNGVLLTDTTLHRWQFSNPIGYGEWFREQMKVVLMEKRAAYASQHRMSIEEVPDYEVKTPLQRVVQILKRHRDICFHGDAGSRPASIVLTTLAARAYRNQRDLYEALESVAMSMHEYVERRKDGKWWVSNPVEEGENFAEKWNEHPDFHKAFRHWLERVRADLLIAPRKMAMADVANALAPALGQNTVTRAATKLGLRTNALTTPSGTACEPRVPALGSTFHCVAPPWPVSVRYRVTLTGTVYAGTRNSKAKWGLTGRPVPRKVLLRFEAKTDAPEPYEVKWQIVNTGQDASQAGCLRGDEFEVSNGETKHIRWEPTLYVGTHWIEAFVIRCGVCVARSQPFKVRIWGQ